MADLLPALEHEAQQLQMLATFQGERPEEVPLREGGLITSHDGLHWQVPQQ